MKASIEEKNMTAKSKEDRDHQALVTIDRVILALNETNKVEQSLSNTDMQNGYF